MLYVIYGFWEWPTLGSGQTSDCGSRLHDLRKTFVEVSTRHSKFIQPLPHPLQMVPRHTSTRRWALWSNAPSVKLAFRWINGRNILALNKRSAWSQRSLLVGARSKNCSANTANSGDDFRWSKFDYIATYISLLSNFEKEFISQISRCKRAEGTRA